MEQKILVCEPDPQETAWLQTALSVGRSPFGKTRQVRLAHTLTEALAWVVKWPPDIVLLDLYLCQDQPDLMAAVEAMKKLAPKAIWVALVPDSSLKEADLNRISTCLLDGALEKQNPANILLRKVERVSPRHPWLQVQLPEGVPEPLSEIPIGPDPKILSPQELQTLCLTACGSGRKEVAKKLNISQETVTTYLKRIKQKLGFSKPVQLYMYGRAYGILPESHQQG